MKWLAQIRRRLAVLFHRERFDRDLEEEMRSHLELQVEENQENGMDAEEARYAAMRHFGNATRLQETSREVWGWRWLESMLQDLRYGFRMLVKNPSFTVAATVTLGFGMGVNTTLFSAVKAILFEEATASAPSRLVLVWIGGAQSVSYPNLWDLRESGILAATAGYRLKEFSVRPGDEAERALGEVVTANYFDVLGVRAAIGRTFSPEEAKPGRDLSVAVLSCGYWRRHFGRDAGILGRTLDIDSGEVVNTYVTGLPVPLPGLPGAGEWDINIPETSNDEVGILTHAFGVMAEQIHSSIRELEKRVLERTRDLERRNTQLQVAAEVSREATAIHDLPNPGQPGSR